jgi:hypothetical protein
MNLYDTPNYLIQAKLRRQLLEFFIENGVNPLYKHDYKGYVFSQACQHGDAECFIKTCQRCDIKLDSFAKDKTLVVIFLRDAMTSKNMSDFKYLLNSFVQVSLDEILPQEGKTIRAALLDTLSLQVPTMEVQEIKEVIIRAKIMTNGKSYSFA